jgi:retron-type reverse transcriptase
MAPKKGLKAVQRSLLQLLSGGLAASDYAHGFVKGRSVRTNAEPHVGKRIVLRFDLENFFGTVTFGRVRGYLLAMGYGFEVATSLALLMTEAERQPVDVDGELRYVPVGHRYCVQGAPTSPLMCNAITTKLDHRLAGLAKAYGFSYTRYADDLTVSGDDESKIAVLLRRVGEIVEAEGFKLNQRKTRVLRSGNRQSVAGVVVNDTLGLSRKDRRILRAKIHRMTASSPSPEIHKLRGELAYLHMLNPAQAEALRPDWLT